MIPSKKVVERAYNLENTELGKLEIRSMKKYNVLAELRFFGVEISEYTVLDRDTLRDMLLVVISSINRRFRKEEN